MLAFFTFYLGKILEPCVILYTTNLIDFKDQIVKGIKIKTFLKHLGKYLYNL